MARSSQKAPQVEVKSRAALRRWLTQHHGQHTGVWLVSYKKHTNHYLPYDDLVDECLCFGWVDSLPRALDEARSMNYIAPRKNRSSWSKVNKERVARLSRAGLMTDAGLAKVERAKADGSWDFLNDVEEGVVPDDLADALGDYPEARSHFDAFPRFSKRIILEWIKSARKPETRARRIAETAQKAQDNIRANHYRK